MAAPLTRWGCRAWIKNRFLLLARPLTGQGPLSQASQPQVEYGAGGPKKIVLPKRKRRDPTSILEALQATTPKDYDAPPYVYADDPFLIPASTIDKRSFSLAKASGKRAADWVMQQLPEVFSTNPAEPSIEAFMPKLPPQNPENTLEGLVERIERNEPLVAFNSYQALKQSGTEIPNSTLEDLIGLLSFYNSEDTSPQLMEEEQFYKREFGKDNKFVKKNWKAHGPAEQVFEEMNEKTPRAYLELFKGRAKYSDSDGAWELFQEMKQHKLPMTDEIYRVALSIANFMSESTQGRWEFIKDVLREMAANDITPSLQTFNTVLSVISRNSRFRDSSKWVLQIIHEMKDCNVEPSLASFSHVIKTIYYNEEVTSNVLNEILDYLEGREMVAQEAADYEFFGIAMPKCYINVKDLELAYKIDDLLNTGNNFMLLGDGFKQGLYCTFFLKTVCMFEQIDKIMATYERITPHMYTPTFSAYDELLRAIELNEGYDYLPQIWSDLVLFDYTRRTDLIDHLLKIMGKRKQPPELQAIYMRITELIREKFEEEKLARRLTPFQLNGEMIGNIMVINLHGERHDIALEFFELYNENKTSVEKFPSEPSLVALAESCIARKEADNTLKIIQLMSDCAYPKVDDVAAKATKGLELNEDQMNFIDDLL